jgi:hypothetical protein
LQAINWSGSELVQGRVEQREVLRGLARSGRDSSLQRVHSSVTGTSRTA